MNEIRSLVFISGNRNGVRNSLNKMQKIALRSANATLSIKNIADEILSTQKDIIKYQTKQFNSSPIYGHFIIYSISLN